MFMKLNNLLKLLEVNKVKVTRTEYSAKGIQKVGTVDVSYNTLVSKLGNPELVDDDGIRVEWNLVFTEMDGTDIPVTVYDWNEEPIDTPIKDVTVWNVASTIPMGLTNLTLLLHNRL